MTTSLITGRSYGDFKTAGPGDVAPDVTVPAVTREGLISLRDYRGRAPVLLGLFRGLYCAFCRRHVASLGLTAEPLRDFGVETIAIVATAVDKARLYFSYQPPRCLVGADPELTSHRAFAVPRTEKTAEIMSVVVERNDELARREGCDVAPGAGIEALARRDRIDKADYAADVQRIQSQFNAQFLIDRHGIIRWSNIECAKDGLAGLGHLPTSEEILSAARAL
jgi:peroxiredoxin